jgi:hypothetical protein
VAYVWRQGDAEREQQIAAQVAELQARARLRRELGPLAVLVDDKALIKRLAEAKPRRPRQGKRLFTGHNRYAPGGRHPGELANPAPAPQPVPAFGYQLVAQPALGGLGLVQLGEPVG